MGNIQISIEDLPEVTIITSKTGRVVSSNQAAKNRFGAAANLSSFAPWFDNRHGWTFCEREDGTTIGIFRPDADETARAKTMLFATLSHEIRTPLNGILGMAGLLGMSELTSAQRSWLQSVEDSGQHLLSLLNDILDFAKLESGKIELENLVFDPIHTLQSVAEICSPRAHEKGLEIAVAVEKNIPRKIVGDDGRLRQIILNLTSNAVKFTQTGGIILRLSAPKPNWLRFAIEDTGIGVPKSKTDLIFEEFSQADSSHTRQFGGTGLGLAIVKKLATAMSGDVGIEARKGGGSIFYANIPFEVVEAAKVVGNELSSVKVAVASNCDVLFDAIHTNLSSYGAKVARISEAKSANKAQVILLDADFDSTKAQEIIKSNSRVVALIGQERRDLIETYRQDGAFGYLIKPLRLGSLLERVKLAVNNQAYEADAKSPANDERAQIEKSHLGLRVLLAEDNRINALLAKSLLERSGCDVALALDGSEALEAIKTAPYDIVFMDCHMPNMDGFEATRAIRALKGKYLELPIVALTAAAMEEDRRKCAAAGMSDFITKPLDPNAIGQILNKWSQKPIEAQKPRDESAA
ncbi:MAG: sensor histidine kinase/response regulator [Hyphomonadaceae bacterium]|nr:MAG: sensor histidine kinase/response regulator [Hyphomonadaceae bacterium]KAF0184980.1 MAG: sensor histidine kinase/response regulator [Hyphomonadaceae bacterium]